MQKLMYLFLPVWIIGGSCIYKMLDDWRAFAGVAISLILATGSIVLMGAGDDQR